MYFKVGKGKKFFPLECRLPFKSSNKSAPCMTPAFALIKGENPSHPLPLYV